MADKMSLADLPEVAGRHGPRFSSPVLDHFYHPRNVGIVARHTHSYLEQDNPWGIRLLFTLRVEKGRIQEVKFKARSCVTTVACASALTEMVEGLDVESIRTISPEQLSQALGIIPQEKMYCSRLVLDTLHKALHLPSSTPLEEHATQGETS